MKQTLQNWAKLFLIGVLGVLPIALIIQIVVWVEEVLRNFVINIYGRYESLIFIPILLFLASIALLTYLGHLIRQDKAYLIYFFDVLIEKIPLLNAVYRVTKKLLTFFQDNDESQRDVVYVEYPSPGIWVPAYVTQRVKDHLVLYVPTSPNPTSGFTVIVHESRVRTSAMSLEDVSSFIISLGVDYAKPEEIHSLISKST